MNTPPPPLLSPPSNPPQRCLSCSSVVPEHPRIRELEAQVQLLSEKLSSTSTFSFLRSSTAARSHSLHRRQTHGL
jgi:hypothetical protein